jgi:NitT/TauT family transport system permease protein
MKQSPNYLGSALIFVGLFTVYGLITGAKLVDPMIFPSLLKILKAGIKSARLLGRGCLFSLRLLTPAFTLAVVLGISIGTVVALNEKLKAVLMPVFHFLNPIPPTMLIPYAIAIFPTFWLSSASIICIGVFWPVLGSTINGIAYLEPRWIDNARCLNMSGPKLIFRIILPGAMPSIFAGIESGLIFSFILLTVGEIFGARAGLGYFVQYYADFAEYDRVIAGMIVLSLVVTIIMFLFGLVKKNVLFWTKKR